MSDDRPPLLGLAARRVRLASLPRDGQRLRFEAGEEDRRAVAGRLGLLSVRSMTADLVAAPWRRDGASLRGRLRAEIEQESVVSLEPVLQSIDEAVDLTFLPAGAELDPADRTEAGEIEIDPEGEDPPDLLEGDAIDVAGVLEEMLALAIDPYPREGGESFRSEAPPGPGAEDERRPSPFAVLAALKGGATDG